VRYRVIYRYASDRDYAFGGEDWKFETRAEAENFARKRVDLQTSDFRNARGQHVRYVPDIEIELEPEELETRKRLNRAAESVGYRFSHCHDDFEVGILYTRKTVARFTTLEAAEEWLHDEVYHPDKHGWGDLGLLVVDCGRPCSRKTVAEKISQNR
jgi:hypothetical protein